VPIGRVGVGVVWSWVGTLASPFAGVTTYHSLFAETNPTTPSNPSPEHSRPLAIVILSEAKDLRAAPTSPERRDNFTIVILSEAKDLGAARTSPERRRLFD
jgi:hypothetical protein